MPPSVKRLSVAQCWAGVVMLLSGAVLLWGSWAQLALGALAVVGIFALFAATPVALSHFGPSSAVALGCFLAKTVFVGAVTLLASLLGFTPVIWLLAAALLVTLVVQAAVAIARPFEWK